MKANTWSPLHYGDPPLHGCVGDTMNCVNLRVVEFWDRSEDVFEWKRLPQFEVELERLNG